jgi:hypothetical protein
MPNNKTPAEGLRERIEDILRKHEENRFSFGEILNRKYTRDAIMTLITEATEQAATSAELDILTRLVRGHSVRDHAEQWCIDRIKELEDANND